MAWSEFIRFRKFPGSAHSTETEEWGQGISQEEGKEVGPGP